jgi:hypothetical protein
MSTNRFRILCGAGDGVGIVSGGAIPAADPPPAAQPSLPEPDAPLGEGGIRALQAERDARADLQRQLAEATQRLQAIDAEKLTDLEKAQQAAEAAATSKAATDAENLRLRFAIDNAVPAAWIDRIKGGTPEELAADWATLQPTITPLDPGKGTVVPGAGHQPPAPPSLAAQIAAAEASGDGAKAMALKTRQLAELAGK